MQKRIQYVIEHSLGIEASDLEYTKIHKCLLCQTIL